MDSSIAIFGSSAAPAAVTGSFAKRVPWSIEALGELLAQHKLVVFARGTKEAPRCGYTARVVDFLETSCVEYTLLDVCSDKSIIPAVTAMFGRCQFPLLVVAGKDLIFDFESLQALAPRLAEFRRANN